MIRCVSVTVSDVYMLVIDDDSCLSVFAAEVVLFGMKQWELDYPSECKTFSVLTIVCRDIGHPDKWVVGTRRKLLSEVSRLS